MYPPVGFITRRNPNEEMLGGYKIPPRTRLIISSFLLHRNPKYWSEPDMFSPERWIHKDDAEREEFNNKIRFAYIPFSAGGRNCIGHLFATYEAKIILSNLIREFSFVIAPSQRETMHTLTSFVSMKAKPGLKICAKRRSALT